MVHIDSTIILYLTKGNSMLLVEQHLIRKSDSRFMEIDRAAFASKNLYNLANYYVRQSFIHEGRYLSYPELAKQLKTEEAFCCFASQSIPVGLETVGSRLGSLFCCH